MRVKRQIDRQIHRIVLAYELAPIGSRLRDSFKLVALALLEPLRSRSRWRGRPVTISVTCDGVDAAFKTIGRTDLEVAREIFVNREYELPSDDEHLTIFDLGAHIGLASIFFANLYPNAQIVAVEADPELIEVLRANVSSLPVQVIHGAVSAESGQRSFFRGVDTWANSIERTRDWQDEITVPALTLDDIRELSGVEHVSLLKFDIEGAEWEMFADGLPDYVDAAIGEVHGDEHRDPAEIVDAISATHCVTVGRADRSRAVFFASNGCSLSGEPLLNVARNASLQF